MGLVGAWGAELLRPHPSSPHAELGVPPQQGSPGMGGLQPGRSLGPGASLLLSRAQEISLLWEEQLLSEQAAKQGVGKGLGGSRGDSSPLLSRGMPPALLPAHGAVSCWSPQGA